MIHCSEHHFLFGRDWRATAETKGWWMREKEERRRRKKQIILGSNLMPFFFYHFLMGKIFILSLCGKTLHCLKLEGWKLLSLTPLFSFSCLRHGHTASGLGPLASVEDSRCRALSLGWGNHFRWWAHPLTTIKAPNSFFSFPSSSFQKSLGDVPCSPQKPHYVSNKRFNPLDLCVASSILTS